MGLALRVNGLDDYGVRLISPASPDFDTLARPLMGERIAHIGLQLKPMLAIAQYRIVRKASTVACEDVVPCCTYPNTLNARWSATKNGTEATYAYAKNGSLK